MVKDAEKRSHTRYQPYPPYALPPPLKRPRLKDDISEVASGSHASESAFTVVL